MVGDPSTGGRNPRDSNDDLLEVFHSADQPFLRTSDVVDADEISIEERQVQKRLKRLVESDHLDSRVVPARARVKIWWLKQVEIRQEWPSEAGDSSSVGVEAVDSLDLPGQFDTLGSRRQAVNSVFKYLFDQEKASASQLRLVGWGADPETYSTPDSLWRNCLTKALDQSSFFQFHTSEQDWRLTEMGEWLKTLDERALWNNWEDHSTALEEEFHSKVWPALTKDGLSVEEFVMWPADRRSGFNLTNEDKGYEVTHAVELDAPIYTDPDITLSIGIQLLDNDGDLSSVPNAIDRIENSIDFTVSRPNNGGSPPHPEFVRNRSIDTEPSTVYRWDGDMLPQPLRETKKWIRRTREEYQSTVNSVI